MQTILVPLDGSPFAEQVLPSVRMLAPVMAAKVHLLRGVSNTEQIELQEPVASSPPKPLVRSLHPYVCEHCTQVSNCQQIDCYLASQALQLRASNVDAYADTRAGAPAAVIATTAEQASSALIAMATHARSGLLRWALGSIAEQVLQATASPLLLVRSAEIEQSTAVDRSLQRILVPLDGSAVARQALPLAIELAVRAGAELILVQVTGASIDEFMRDFPVAANLRSALHEQAMQALHGLAHLGAAPLHLSTAVALGPIAEAIASEAAWRRADLIVMATPGNTKAQLWKHGSVADQLLRATTAPVILVRA